MNLPQNQPHFLPNPDPQPNTNFPIAQARNHTVIRTQELSFQPGPLIQYPISHLLEPDTTTLRPLQPLTPSPVSLFSPPVEPNSPPLSRKRNMDCPYLMEKRVRTFDYPRSDPMYDNIADMNRTYMSNVHNYLPILNRGRLNPRTSR